MSMTQRRKGEYDAKAQRCNDAKVSMTQRRKGEYDAKVSMGCQSVIGSELMLQRNPNFAEPGHMPGCLVHIRAAAAAEACNVKCPVLFDDVS